MTDVIQRLPPLSIPTLLDELEAIRLRGHARPRLTVHLASGAALEGRFVALDRRARPPALLLHDAGDDGAKPETHALYVDARAVVAVCVHHADRHAADLARGEVIAPSDADVPGKLAMRRHLAETVRAVADRCDIPLEAGVAWDDFPDPPQGRDARWALWATLESLRAAMTALLDWDDGRAAIADKLQALRVVAAPESHVFLEDRTLVVGVCEPTDADALRAQIEGVL